MNIKQSPLASGVTSRQREQLMSGTHRHCAHSSRLFKESRCGADNTLSVILGACLSSPRNLHWRSITVAKGKRFMREQPAGSPTIYQRGPRTVCFKEAWLSVPCAHKTHVMPLSERHLEH